MQTLWSLVRDGAPATPGLAAIAALIALELGDRARLRALAAPLTAASTTACGRILLARVYLGSGQRELADATLAGADSPVARLLRARILAAADRAGTIARLAELVELFPGWSEARLGSGSRTRRPIRRARSRSSRRRRWRGGPTPAALGPPETARAAARLAAGELLRRAGRSAEAARAVTDALARAPASPLVARQAAALAVALRAPELAREAQRRLEAVTPGATIVARLAGALHELAGDHASALASYRSAGAWDRVVVLAARARELLPDARREAALAAGLTARDSGSFSLPPAFDVEDTASVAALQAAAVSVQRADPALAARARAGGRCSARVTAGSPRIWPRRGVACARAALAGGDPTTLMETARDLDRALGRAPDDAALREAAARVGVAIATRWIQGGEHDSARARLAELHARLGSPYVALHALALAIRTLRVDEAYARLARAPAGPHRELLEALLAEQLGDVDGVRARLPGLVTADGFVGSAARLCDVLHRGGPRGSRGGAGTPRPSSSGSAATRRCSSRTRSRAPTRTGRRAPRSPRSSRARPRACPPKAP